MRAVSQYEEPLIRYLYMKAGIGCDFSRIDVEPMKDGGMGSLRIVSSEMADQRFGSSAAECFFYDSDGVLVTAALYLDHKGNPFEVDVWKVDFSPLSNWPNYEEITDDR